jgi:RES domain-containing protein
VNRMNFALSFAANRLPKIATEWRPTQNANNAATALQADSTAPDAQAEEARLQSVLLPGGVSETTRAAVLQQFEQQRNKFQSSAVPFPVAAGERQRFRARATSAAERQDQLLAGLLLGSPEFQRR